MTSFDPKTACLISYGSAIAVYTYCSFFDEKPEDVTPGISWFKRPLKTSYKFLSHMHKNKKKKNFHV